jgi:hypothetical protein
VGLSEPFYFFTKTLVAPKLEFLVAAKNYKNSAGGAKIE